MCKFKPFNKHLLIKRIQEEEKTEVSPVLIPEGAQVGEQERYGLVKFVCASADCEQFLRDLNPDRASWATQHGTHDDVFTTSVKSNGGANLVVDKSMIEEIKLKDQTFHVVHQNYVVGVIGE